MSKRVLFAIPIVLAAYALSNGFPVRSGRTAVVLAQNQAATTATENQQAQPSQGNMAGMMKMHQEMMAQMTAADTKLDQLVSQMKTATGEAKISLMADVVTELVRQQRTMHEHMGMMHDQMMGGRGMMMKKP